MNNVVKDLRLSELSQWARETLGDMGFDLTDSFQLQKASDDASFRRYFRGSIGERSFIFMDAPPQLEDSGPFVDIAQRLHTAGINVPRVHRANLEHGFLMLDDFGSMQLLDGLKSGEAGNVDKLYQDAMAALHQLHQVPIDDNLPRYDDHKILEEMLLFPEWFLKKQLAIEPDAGEQALLESVFSRMLDNVSAQPVVFVHRDYHARNLMVLQHRNPGILDFQDAVAGPVTYDLVSLFRDCYVRWPAERVYGWVRDFYLAMPDNKTLDPDQFVRWFDLMGMQRHLKCAGIFSRLNLRDGKPGYLADIPLVLEYLVEVSSRYAEFSDFQAWLEQKVVPIMNIRLKR